MSTITDYSSIFTEINTSNTTTTATETSQATEDSEMFMELMIAQLQNQDPTSPTDTSEFMAQISTMSQVESTNNLVTAIESMSSSLISSQSALQASSMVGQTVVTETDTTTSDEDGVIAGAISLTDTTDNVRITIYDENGAEIDVVDLGAGSVGDKSFTWQGDSDDAGSQYTIVAEVQTDSGAYEEVSTLLSNRVTSVTLGVNGVGMTVNTVAGSTLMDDIIEIGV